MPTAPLRPPSDQERNSVVSVAKDLAEKKCKGTRWLPCRYRSAQRRHVCKTLQALAATNSREPDEAATQGGPSGRSCTASRRCARRHTTGTVQCRDHTACGHRCAGGGE